MTSKNTNKRLDSFFFRRDAIIVAQELLGKILVRRFEDGSELRWAITETEAYCGEEDEACHASKGRSPRTEVMYKEGGCVYVYLIYGIYWLLNFVTGPTNHPQAVLIRALDTISGPGRVGKLLQLNRTFYGEDVAHSTRLWLEFPSTTSAPQYNATKRIGIDYATDEWRLKPWRFRISNSKQD